MSETNLTPSQKDALEVLLGGQIIKIQKSLKVFKIRKRIVSGV